MQITTGCALTDDDWTVDCPECEHVMHYQGYFDPDDVRICEGCGLHFKCKRLYFDDGSYIQ